MISEYTVEDLRNDILASLDIGIDDLDDDANLLQLGLDSIDMMEWVGRFKRQGFDLTLLDLYQQPTLIGWSSLLSRSTRSFSVPVIEQTAFPQMSDGEPFPISTVQHAYLVGRSPQQAFGGVGCHVYHEFDGSGMDPIRLESAVAALIDRHPMLRVEFQQGGTQRLAPHKKKFPLEIHDLRELSEQQQAATLLSLRDKWSHRLMEVEKGETFHFQLSLLTNGRHRLHVNIDLLIADAVSYSLLLEDLSSLISGAPLPLVAAGYDFRSYLKQREAEEHVSRERSRDYWTNQLDQLPLSPALPLAGALDSSRQPRFTRRAAILSSLQWERFRMHAGSCGLTAPLALATCYGAVLGRWTGQQRLLLNLTLFDRQPLHPAIERTVADFTNILLLGMQCSGGSFRELAMINQHTFAASYEHAQYSGVEVMRDLKKLSRHPHGAPIVFTSNIGRSLLAENVRPILGEPGWGVSQTPQVWLDHQALEDQNSILLQWDSNDELFAPGLIGALFDTYVATVKLLADHSVAWQNPLPELMPATQREARARVNDTGKPLPSELLHDGFFGKAESIPGSVAIFYGDQEISYAELNRLAQSLASSLQDRGIRAGDLIAISMSRGLGQIVSVLGVLYAGAIYVPVSVEQPFERRQQIYRSAGISFIVTCTDDEDVYEMESLPSSASWQALVEEAQGPAKRIAVSNDQPAYVIYTSGSTGLPKGVVISHRSALNTCLDITERNGVRSNDRVLALSALHFDLSVYDIFGILGAGGALVLLREEQRRDPMSWCALIERHNISLWNSVPALFDMLLTYSEGFALRSPAKLRLVLLSGDWIGLDLPKRYRSFREDGALVAMGGATEAAIWSNFFDVGDVSPDWRSIPYGYPLANQRFRVVDELGRDCPDWIPGELWIGGAGVAIGYLNDAERTAQQFIESEDGRWYRTGDVGCYWPDGRLEFLGRRDRQVKVGGYRIELEEIDAALHSLEEVRSGITIALGDREKTLASFVVADAGAFTRLIASDSNLPGHYEAIAEKASARLILDSESENLATRLVCDFLREHFALEGIDFTSPISFEGCVERYRCLTEYRELFTQWLNVLAQQEIVTLDRSRCYVQGPAYGRSAWKPEPGTGLYPVYEALLAHHMTLSSIVRGERRAETLLDHPFWSPEALQFQIPGAVELLTSFGEEITRLAHRLKRPVKLVEIGARSGLAAEWLLSRVGRGLLDYVALDESQEMVLRIEARFQANSALSARRWDKKNIGNLRQCADITWANNTLHRLADPAQGLNDMLEVAAPSGILSIHEAGSAPPLALVSVSLFQDQGKIATRRLRSPSFWSDLFDSKDLASDLEDTWGGIHRFILRAPGSVATKDINELRAALASKLPSYMIPQRLFFIESIPLTANGKIDHKALAEYCTTDSEVEPTIDSGPRTTQESVLFELWESLLKVTPPHRDVNFFELGGDSLLATRMIGELDRIGYGAQLADLFANPTLAAFAITMREGVATSTWTLLANDGMRYDPFPLTEVQQAYLVGRNPAFPLGGVGSHFFMEFAVTDLDTNRFEEIWNRLIVRHDMLRTVIREGQQQVLKHVPHLRIQIHRLSDVHSPDGDAIRDRLAHQVLNPAIWPVFCVQVAQDNSSVSRVFIGLDNLLLDGMSMQILMDELARLYLNPSLELSAIDIQFRDYLTTQMKPEDIAASSLYWQHRMEELPRAPQLPLRRDPSTVHCPHFIRLADRLPSQTWADLRRRAAAMQLTPSALLLTAYAAVLSNWSGQRELSLNVTFFDRQPVHPHIDRVLGDFTSLLLLAWTPAETWAATAQDLQHRLQQDIVHRNISAIRIMRDLSRRHGTSIAFPVVFTSALGYDKEMGILSRSSWLRPVWGISQTPQVWLDHQVYESDGELALNWDVVEELFNPGVLREMFGQYLRLLTRLSEDGSAWSSSLDELLPSAQAVSTMPYQTSHEAPARAQRTAAPHTLVDEICRHFEKEFGSTISRDQHFFDAGATSLDLVRLHIHLTQAGYSILEVTDLFAYPSPAALAEKLAEGGVKAIEKDDSGRRMLLDQRAARRLRRSALATQMQD